MPPPHIIIKSLPTNDVSFSKLKSSGIFGEVGHHAGTGFPIQGSRVQNHWGAPRSTQLFIVLRSIK